MINSKELKAFFESTSIPEIKEKPTTFLGIAKQPHYENVWSNIYAFYFDVNAEHGLKDLFVISLLELVNEKTSEAFKLSHNCDIQTEVSTNKGGRIDLLLSNAMDAIIIENKVYHYLDNDLEDYWNSTKQLNKQGIVLSLKSISHVPHPNFVNITHLEFLNRVMQKLGNYLLNASDKYTIFLKDFYQNTLNLSDPMNEQNLKFFYAHSAHINQAVELQESTRKYVETEVVKACDLLKMKYCNIGGKVNRGFNVYESNENQNLVFLVCFGFLLEGKKYIEVVLQLQNELLKDNRQLLSGLALDENEKKLVKSDFYTRTENWAHFAVTSFEVSPEDFLNLSDFIATSITTSPLSGLMKKMEDFLFGKEESNN